MNSHQENGRQMITFTVIESPFAGDVEANLTYARRAMADCFARGEIPICGHALYTQKGVLDDKKPEERRKGMEATFTLRATLERLAFSADAKDVRVLTVVYCDMGVSKGMQQGIDRSEVDGVPVIFRFLESL